MFLQIELTLIGIVLKVIHVLKIYLFYTSGNVLTLLAINGSASIASLNQRLKNLITLFEKINLTNRPPLPTIDPVLITYVFTYQAFGQMIHLMEQNHDQH